MQAVELLRKVKKVASKKKEDTTVKPTKAASGKNFSASLGLSKAKKDGSHKVV